MLTDVVKTQKWPSKNASCALVQIRPVKAATRGIHFVVTTQVRADRLVGSR
jgi:hypothetical protein